MLNDCSFPPLFSSIVMLVCGWFAGGWVSVFVAKVVLTLSAEVVLSMVFSRGSVLCSTECINSAYSIMPSTDGDHCFLVGSDSLDSCSV